jgi:hypothetical protein
LICAKLVLEVSIRIADAPRFLYANGFEAVRSGRHKIPSPSISVEILIGELGRSTLKTFVFAIAADIDDAGGEPAPIELAQAVPIVIVEPPRFSWTPLS